MSRVKKVNKFSGEETTLYYSELEGFSERFINVRSKDAMCILKSYHVSLKENTNLYVNFDEFRAK